MINPFILFGIVGLILRLIFMPLSLHSDLLWAQVFPTLLASRGIIDIYAYFLANFSDSLVKQGAYYYGPFAYLLLGGFDVLGKFFIPGLLDWLQSYINIITVSDPLAYLEFLNSAHQKIFLYLSWMKMPYLLFDVLCLVMLLSYFDKKEEKITAFKLWMLNPVIIFGSYIFGQFDIIIVFFLLLSLFFIRKSKTYIAMMILGAAALFKSTSLVLILPLAFIAGKTVKQSLKFISVGFIPLFIFFVPLYIKDGSYVLGVLFPPFIKGGGAKPIDAFEFLVGKAMFTIGYIFLLLHVIRVKTRPSNLFGWPLFLVFILLSYFVVIFTPIHYLQWAVPFLIIGVAKKDIPFSIYLLQIICIFLYAINSKALSGQLFLPLNPDLLYNIKSLPEYMNQFIKWGIVMRLARWSFHACSLYIIWKLMFKKEVKSA